MSSLEIAKLTGKEHKNVLADIRKILEEAGISTTEFSAVYKDQQLIDRPCFNLPFRETNLIISGYSVKHRLVIIDRWQELEAQNKPQLPTNYIEALQALIESEKAKEALQLELDKAHAWLSIKRVAKLNGKDWRDYSYQKLKSASVVVGHAPHKIFDANYGTINTYHAEAWALIYPDALLK